MKALLLHQVRYSSMDEWAPCARLGRAAQAFWPWCLVAVSSSPPPATAGPCSTGRKQFQPAQSSVLRYSASIHLMEGGVADPMSVIIIQWIFWLWSGTAVSLRHHRRLRLLYRWHKKSNGCCLERGRSCRCGWTTRRPTKTRCCV